MELATVEIQRHETTMQNPLHSDDWRPSFSASGRVRRPEESSISANENSVDFNSIMQDESENDQETEADIEMETDDMEVDDVQEETTLNEQEKARNLEQIDSFEPSRNEVADREVVDEYQKPSVQLTAIRQSLIQREDGSQIHEMNVASISNHGDSFTVTRQQVIKNNPVNQMDHQVVTIKKVWYQWFARHHVLMFALGFATIIVLTAVLFSVENDELPSYYDVQVKSFLVCALSITYMCV